MDGTTTPVILTHLQLEIYALLQRELKGRKKSLFLEPSKKEKYVMINIMGVRQGRIQRGGGAM